MDIIKIRTQKALDALPDKFEEYTRIEIRTRKKICITKLIVNGYIMVLGTSTVEVKGYSHVVALENSYVIAEDASFVEARQNSFVRARGRSIVEGWENSSIVAQEESNIIALTNSSVVAMGSSLVSAREDSSVIALGMSRVIARDRSTIVAGDHSTIIAHGHSSIEAHGFSMISVLDKTVTLKRLLDYSMTSLRGFSSKIGVRAKTARVVKTPLYIKDPEESFFDLCESDQEGTVILYKSVNPVTLCDFYTGKIKYEGIVECPDWDPDPSIEYGNGLHLSRTKLQALSYNIGRILKCRVRKEDIVLCGNDTSKVRCRRVEVLDQKGERLCEPSK